MSEKRTRVRTHLRRTSKGKVVRVTQHLRSVKGKEFAPGIPASQRVVPVPQVKHPQYWQVAIQRHEARRRGSHYDLRLGRGGNAYSWAVSSLPKPGEQVWAIEQPTHSQWYMTWEGTIAEGEYGAGEVKVVRSGHAIVTESGPKKVNFTIVDGKQSEDLALIRIGGRTWKLINFSPKAEEVSKYQHKPKYRGGPIEKLKSEEETVWSAKIDGAHGIAVLQTGKRPRIYSYRKPVKGGHIEWTHKIPGLFAKHVPTGLGDTVVRVEVYAKDKKGKPLDVEHISGMLNAGIMKSRQLQKEKGKLRPALIDVVKWRGVDYSKASGLEKLQILREIQKRMPLFELPEVAETPEGKRRLAEAIKAGTQVQTAEGVVAIPKGLGPFVKGKFRPEDDVYVRGIFEAKKGSKFEGVGVGGFTYSWTPTGKIVGRVGTGLSDEMRRDMFRSPERYVGRVARVKGQRYRSGVGRTLSFVGWHGDKGPSVDELVELARKRNAGKG